MDSSKYQSIVEQILTDYANFLGNDDQVQVELVFDRSRVAFGTALLLAIFSLKQVGRMATASTAH